METLNLEKFSPKKTELISLAEECRNIIINGIEDKEGYEKANRMRIQLKNTRVEIQKTGKILRTDALAFQKAVIAREKELIDIIEPTEIELKEKQDKIDEEKEIIKRQKFLPDRKERLLKIGVSIDDSFILLMDDIKFENFYNEKKSEFLAEKERSIAEEKIKLEESQRIEEAKKQARIEAEERAKQELENAKQKAELDKQEALRKAEAEKQAIIAEQNKKEQARIEAEGLKRLKEIEAQKILESQKKYQKFLKDNGYSDNTKNDFYIQQSGNKTILFRKIGEIIINS